MKKRLIFILLGLFLISFIIAQNNTNQTCTEDWQCGSWSDCINDTKTRTCTDSNNCNTSINTSSESQSCETINETCIQQEESCCLGEICNMVSITCLEGEEVIFEGCDDNCTAQASCNETCKNEGETISGTPNITGETCCEGLDMINVAEVNTDGTCSYAGGALYCSDCGDGTCEEWENICNCPEDCETSEEKVCCHKFGYGNQMKKVNSKYQWIEESDCVTPEGFVGGGREIIDDEYCRKRIRPHANISECPDNCTCTGSTIKCELQNGRIMTVYAGRSGNMIIQVKGINMTTNVTLYKSEGKIYGVFNGNDTKEVKMLPDQVRERIRGRIRARLENQTIELDKDGIYRIQGKKKARLFFLFPVREKVRIQIDSETGEVIKIRNPWWGFLARDSEEEPLIGGCGTVTPGMENECCQNLGYDLWNEETIECEFSE